MTSSELWFPGDELLEGCIEIVGPDDLLGVWPLYGPQLATDAAILLQPDDFSTDPPWKSTSLTWSGTNTCRETAANDAHNWRQDLAGQVSIGPFRWGIDLQDDGRRYARIHSYDGSGYHYYVVDLQTGATSGVSGCTPRVTDLGAGMWRCEMLDTVCANPASAYVRVYLSPDGTTLTYPGDITKGLKAYNATISQTSIVTAPNLYGAYMLARYGDRFDLTNPTKSSQPVLAPDWAGLDCGVFSAANYLYADAVAAQFTGTAKPLAWLLAQAASGISKYAMAFGNSADNTPYRGMVVSAATHQVYGARDNSGASVSAGGVAAISSRSIVAQSAGTNVFGLLNGAADMASSPSALGVMTLDRFTLGALGRIGLPTTPYEGLMRYVVVAKSAPSDAVMQAASRLVQAYCPVA